MSKAVKEAGIIVGMVAALFAMSLNAGMFDCTSEGAHNCYWNATTQGNGQGDSFVDIAGHVFYFGGGDR